MGERLPRFLTVCSSGPMWYKEAVRIQTQISICGVIALQNIRFRYEVHGIQEV